MNSIVRGLISGTLAGLMVGILYFVDYGPGNGLHGIARWFALDSSANGKFVGFILLLVLGALFGLIFGVLQGRREITIGRALGTGLGLGIAWWIIFAFLVAMVVGHISLAQLTIGSFLYSFVLCLVYGLLLGMIYFQSTVRRTIATL